MQLLGSGAILQQALKAQELLESFGVSADVWSVTSFKRLRSEAQAAKRWNMLHPTESPRKSYLEQTVEGQQGPWIAVSDNLKLDSGMRLKASRRVPVFNGDIECRWMRFDMVSGSNRERNKDFS